MESENNTIIGEIQKILPKLDAESLNFLKEQASVLLYNREVRERNIQLEEARNSGKKISSNNKTDERASDHGVYIEALKNGKFFNLCIDDAKLFMDKQEIKALFQIAIGAESSQAGTASLYKWFLRERKDVLVDGYISHEKHPRLKLIYKALLDTFTL